LDIGCAVGRASFELAQVFAEVIGIDYSHGFVKTCNVLKQSGRMEYEVTTEGNLTTKHEACIPSHLVITINAIAQIIFKKFRKNLNFKLLSPPLTFYIFLFRKNTVQDYFCLIEFCYFIYLGTVNV